MFVFFVALAICTASGVFFGVGATGGTGCGPKQACFPWLENSSATRCQRGGRINLRFMLDLPQGDTEAPSTNQKRAVYAFCPIVDELQVFTLKGAGRVSSLLQKTSSSGQASITPNPAPRYLSVFGFGRSGQKEYPERDVSNSTVVIAMRDIGLCNSPDSVAIVNMVILTIGMHDGKFNYISSDADTKEPDDSESGIPSGNSSGTGSPMESVQPAMVGFRPTCDESDHCIFSPTSPCVGPIRGMKNCGACYNTPDDIEGASIQVWTSYQGTDLERQPLLSGGMDPMGFRKFAGGKFVGNIKYAVSKIENTASGMMPGDETNSTP
ncbi:uncharacterized protein TEOVI_000561000 [Trypanosoma equiperdum]|uniref:Uncharacterized protein n=2 Tax=Trypanozoon TaxID=39700 RepID=Q586Z3_TRYB2|nr:hypothetical protein, conserved [Trypanosoma brucei brucei TREU927]AAX79284.1 hypothetical protein, conserved [Trypanosoma brucei]AAZ11985.1 hypothetical protein, conserved [Trypanosoma brucei brucei TREU927]SCU65318.1 hypothetical protein, conserved [Trypanosoma equiperdum]